MYSATVQLVTSKADFTVSASCSRSDRLILGEN